MVGDCSVRLDVGPTESEEVATLRPAVTHNARWKMTAATLAIALCFAVALCVSLHVKVHTGKEDDLHLHLRQISTNVRAAIHLQGKYNATVQTSVEWKKDVDQYHSEGELELQNNEIVIPDDGVYFVYSQASFRVSCYTDNEYGAKQVVRLSHGVARWSESYSTNLEEYEIILDSSHTACEKTPNMDPKKVGKWSNALYMGAVFKLNKHDKLKTVTKNLPDVDDETGKTFFGVFAL